MQILECKYIKMDTYFFYLKIEAIEDGNFGVYEAKVIISPSGGEMTLGRFVLINRGKRSGKHFGTSNPDDWLDPEDDFYVGLVSRDEQDVSQGFDYLCPFGSSGL